MNLLLVAAALLVSKLMVPCTSVHALASPDCIRPFMLIAHHINVHICDFIYWLKQPIDVGQLEDRNTTTTNNH